MKEYLSQIEPEDYDKIIYPRMVMGHDVAQRNMFTDDWLIYPNPEKYPPTNNHDLNLKPEPSVNHLQGEFKL